MSQRNFFLHRPTKMSSSFFFDKFPIGTHWSKSKTLLETVKSFPDPANRPYQIFISNPQSCNVNAGDADLEATYAYVKANSISFFIHAPYIINLASSPSDTTYATDCLIKTLTYGARMGAKGVVVHVGKSCKLTLPEALKNMKENIARVLPAATLECPLLLETPAGQGTEMLIPYEDFVGFVKGFQNPAFGVCVDTCHVFAAGHCPYTYITRMMKEEPGLLHLIHFNDSKEGQGCCKDRHETPGGGKIKREILLSIAAVTKGIDKVYE